MRDLFDGPESQLRAVPGAVSEMAPNLANRGNTGQFSAKLFRDVNTSRWAAIRRAIRG